ncbi:MAG: uracil-DNA glycosylase, partial [Flavobacteriaceae bacterium]
MHKNLSESWATILQTEFEKPYFKELTSFVKSEYENHNCYPKEKNIFATFDFCSFDDLKVVIIGQDPYHGE